jgi:hypothetical protein
MSEIKDASTSDERAKALHRKEGGPDPTPAPIIKRRRWPVVLTTGTLLAGAGGGIGAIWFFSSVFADLTARATFVVGSAINLFIFLAIVAQACIYWGQRSTMNEQAKVMREGLKETRNLLRQNEWTFRENQRHASATQTQMHEQSEAMKGQLKTMRDSLAQNQAATEKGWQFATAQGLATCEQLIAMREQALISRGQVHVAVEATKISERNAKAAEMSAEAAQRGVEVMKESYVATTRAYIGIREITVGTLVVGDTPTVSVIWHNGGQTPASKFRASVYLVFGEKPERRGYGLDDDWSDSKTNFVPPGVSNPVAYSQAEYGFKPVTKDMLDALNGGSQRLYAMIKAEYRDFTDQPRPFETSYIFNPFEGTFTEL